MELKCHALTIPTLSSYKYSSHCSDIKVKFKCDIDILNLPPENNMVGSDIVLGMHGIVHLLQCCTCIGMQCI